MTTEMWYFLGIAATGVLTYLGVRFSSRASVQVAKETAESLVYSKAAALWEQSNEGLVADVKRLRVDLEEARAKIDGLVARGEASELREYQLTERVRILERVLRDNQIEVPPWHVNFAGGERI